MPRTDYLIDTNILIYHVAGSTEAAAFMKKVMAQELFNISIKTLKGSSFTTQSQTKT